MYTTHTETTRLSQGCYNHVSTRLWQPCTTLGFEPVTRLSQGCHKVVAGLYFTTSAQACHNVVVVQWNHGILNPWYTYMHAYTKKNCYQVRTLFQSIYIRVLWADLFFAACRASSDSINQNTVFVHIRCVTKHSSVKNGTAVNYIFICYLLIHVEIMSWYSGCSWPVTTWDSYSIFLVGQHCPLPAISQSCPVDNYSAQDASYSHMQYQYQ